MVRGAKTITIPRCLYQHASPPPKSTRLIGFCDASAKAYGAVVYFRLEDESAVDVKFVAAKTRVAPLGGMTIPRLELLSALLLAKLIASITAALEREITLEDPVCFSDSKAALFWIWGTRHEWKQFVENRVSSIRALVHPHHWRHCPGTENPADIPSRGASVSTLIETKLWLHGPHWLHTDEFQPGGCQPDDSNTERPAPPEDCRREMKHKEVTHTFAASDGNTPNVSQLITAENHSSAHRLFRITALVLKFIRNVRSRLINPARNDATSVGELEQAKLIWIREMQSRLQNDKRFRLWKLQLGLFLDKVGVWRCGGRLSNSDLSLSTQNPILLDKTHHLTTLIARDAHKRVLHNGVQETLAELRSFYWVIRGRLFIRKLIHSCTVCRRMEGTHCAGVPTPPLPGHRVRQSRPFQTTGVDFAGPLYVRTSDNTRTSKVWLCLYTCCTTRAVHLELVPDLSTVTFMRCFRRFAARRGTPSMMLSDNAKTFKSAAVKIGDILKCPETKTFLDKLNIGWRFNLEKAPWWGGFLSV